MDKLSFVRPCFCHHCHGKATQASTPTADPSTGEQLNSHTSHRHAACPTPIRGPIRASGTQPAPPALSPERRHQQSSCARKVSGGGSSELNTQA